MKEFELNKTVNFSILLLGIPVLAIWGNWIVTSIYILILFFLFLLEISTKADINICLPYLPLWILIFLWNLYTASKANSLRIGFDYYAGTIVTPFLIYFVILNANWNKQSLTRFFDFLILSGVILGLYSLYIFIDSGFNFKLRIPSIWESFNILSAYLMILFLFNLSFLINKNTFKKKIFYSITIVIILLGIFFTQTRGVWLATVLAIIFFVIKKPKVIIPTFLIMGAIGILFFNVINDRFLSVKNFGNDVSSLGRLQAWLSSIILIQNNFFLGYGFDAYLQLRDTVFSFYFVELPHSHNTYLRMILESGFIGFVLYFIFFFAAFIFTFKLLKNKELTEYKGFLDGLQLSLFALLIAFNFEPYLSLYGISTIVIWIMITFAFMFKFNVKSLIKE